MADNADRIELFHLPPYAPQCDPDEYVNNDTKQAIGRSAMPKDKATMKAAPQRHMRGPQHRPDKVRSFFLTLDVLYDA